MDAPTLGLAHLLAQVRTDVVYPGCPEAVIKRRVRPACDITTDAPDITWIPRVAAEGWVIITRDAKILERTAELKALREHSVRAAVIVSTGQLDTWAQLEVVVTQWRRIEALVDRAGPLVAKMTRTTFDDSALADARRTT